jgi:16S rRNA (cytosine967-C5)-methyltransferase
VVTKQDKNPREIALNILYDVEVKGAFADTAVSSSAGDLRLSSVDRRFIQELVFGTTKMRRRLDFVLEQFLERKAEDLTPWIRNVLRMGIYQIDFLQKVPPSAAVNESVKLAKRFGHKGTVALVNAVLRNYLRDKGRVSFPSRETNPVQNIALFYSFPDWMVEEWMILFGEEDTVRLCEEFNRKPHISCRLNSLKTDPDRLEQELEATVVKFKMGRYLDNYITLESRIDLDRFAPLREGLVYIQDESAGLPVKLLDPQPGERLLDLCAAPGGKATHMAELMRDQGLIVAVDLGFGKLKTLSENCRRLEARSVIPCCGDARNFSCHPLDRVLVDAPCTALGTLGGNPDARWRKQKEDPARLHALQTEILLNAAGLVKRGGVLVYSTCTLTAEENEQVIEEFLVRHPDFRLADASDFVPSDVVDDRGMIRTLPHVHKIDGAFACRMERATRA